MTCTRCLEDRIVQISGKCGDMCFVEANNKERNNYVPYDMGIGGGDYIEFSFCMNCGQIAGKWPLPQTEMEQYE